MAFERVVDLSIGDRGTGFQISALDIEFEIEKTRTFSENTAAFTIYNMKQQTRTNVLKKGNNLIFKAGYDDEVVAIQYIGNITKSFSEKKSVDWVSKIECSSIRSQGESLKIIEVSLSYTKEVTLSTPLLALADLSGLGINGLENISAIPLPNGWTYAGTFLGAIRYIKQILETQDIGIYIDNNEIVIYKMNGDSVFKTVLLNFNSGLLSVENISKVEEEKLKRVKFDSILIPDLRVNGVITFTGVKDDIDGSYVVDKLSIKGNNFGGDFNMSGEAVAGEALA